MNREAFHAILSSVVSIVLEALTVWNQFSNCTMVIPSTSRTRGQTTPLHRCWATFRAQSRHPSWQGHIMERRTPSRVCQSLTSEDEVCKASMGARITSSMNSSKRNKARSQHLKAQGIDFNTMANTADQKLKCLMTQPGLPDLSKQIELYSI